MPLMLCRVRCSGSGAATTSSFAPSFTSSVCCSFLQLVGLFQPPFQFGSQLLLLLLLLLLLFQSLFPFLLPLPLPPACPPLFVVVVRVGVVGGEGREGCWCVSRGREGGKGREGERRKGLAANGGEGKGGREGGEGGRGEQCLPVDDPVPALERAVRGLLLHLGLLPILAHEVGNACFGGREGGRGG